MSAQSDEFRRLAVATHASISDIKKHLERIVREADDGWALEWHSEVRRKIAALWAMDATWNTAANALARERAKE